MPDRYSQLVDNPVGGFIAKNLGLPKPVELDRYTGPGAPPSSTGPSISGASGPW